MRAKARVQRPGPFVELTVAAACAVVLAGCSASDLSDRPLPPASASPVAVVKTYLSAAKRQDCSFTRAMTQAGSTWNWCEDPRLLDYRAVGRAEFVPASEAGVNERCVSFEMDTDGSSDATIPTGWEGWGLCLVDTRAGWRVHDQGQG